MYEYTIGTYAYQPDMSGKQRYTILTSSTYLNYKTAKAALGTLPVVADRPKMILRRPVPEEWEHYSE